LELDPMGLPITFNNIPGSGLTAPLFAFESNSAGQYSSSSRVLLVGHKTNAGAAALNVPVVIGSQIDADYQFGGGSMLREMFRIARQNAPVQEIWAVPVADAGVAPTWSLTVGAAAIAAGVGILRVCDELIQIPITAADTTTTIAAAIAAAINAYFNPLTLAMLPVTAAAASAVVTATSRHLGAAMADVEFYVPSVQGNLFSGTGLTVATGVAGSGTPSLSTAFAALGDDQFDMIVVPFSDATSITAISALMNDTSGRWSYSRQSYGHVFVPSTGALSAQTTLTLALNDRHLTVIPRLAGSPHPAWLWAAGFVARVAPWLGDYATGNVSRNQTDLVVQGLTAPRDPSTLWQYASRNTLNNSGCSSWKGNLDRTVSIDKLVTTYQKGASGQPDVAFRDVQAMLQLTHILRYLRATLANSCGNKAIADTNPGALGAIVTPKDIKAILIGAYDQLAQWGLVENVAAFAQAVTVQRDTTGANRVNVLLPIQRVKPLDILAANAVLYTTIPVAA
jgi:phage tail sheath gpL-like